MMEHRERIAVIGGGIAGLSCALAIGRDPRFRVTVFEKDGDIGDLDLEQAFTSWKRPGVAHLRHSHVFLARLYNLIRDEYPDLQRELLDAGCRELRFADGLPPYLKARYRPLPEDEDFTILSSRRTTLEFVMRRYVQRLAGVSFETDTEVNGLLLEPAGTTPEVVGLQLAADDANSERRFDVVIDAAGKRSPCPGWLREAGITIDEETHPAGILYLTRHYRFRPGYSEPERGDLPGNGDLDYFKFGIFPADRGNFSITVALPEDEKDLRIAVKKPELFDQACNLCPAIARWIDPQRAEPRSKVYGMGGLESHWLHYVRDDQPAVLGFFAAGDSVIRTNPLYGRGCSSGALQAHSLAGILARSSCPIERARRYAAVQWSEIRPFYDAMTKQDRQTIRRAARTRDPSSRSTWRQRFTHSFVRDGILIASRGDITVLRALMRGFHMLEDPNLALKNKRILLRIVSYWLRPSFAKKHLRLPKVGPSRQEMFRTLGIAATIDR